MHNEIGQVAGKVFEYLETNSGKEVPLDAVRKSVGGSTTVFHMAIGWLAREGKLNFSARGRTTMVSLNEVVH